MNKMRKLMEAVQLNEYFVKRGMTVEEVFSTILGTIDPTDRENDSEEFEPTYLRSLGFRDAARMVIPLTKRVASIKKSLQPIWDQPAVNEEALDLLDNLPHLEALEEYNHEDLYIENVVPSFDRAIEIFQEYGTSLAEEAFEDDFEGPFDPSAEMRERF